MRITLAAVSIMGLLGAGAFVTWSVISRPDDPYITGEAANGFNLKTGPAPARASVALSSGETLRDAVISAAPVPSSLTHPIAFAGMAVGGVAPKPQARKPLTVITPRAEAWAKKHKLLTALLAWPARFLMDRSSLASARGLRAFLADKRKVDAYLNSSLVRVTLNSPAVAKAVLGHPALVRAFLASPAMRDPRAARELLGSPLLHKMMDCPAIQEALGDPTVMRKMIADPQTVSFFASHPQALRTIAEAVPALGDVLALHKTRR